jgi:hypothetical protein
MIRKNKFMNEMPGKDLEIKSESEKFPALSQFVDLAEIERKKEYFIQLLFKHKAYSLEKNEGLEENSSRAVVIAEEITSFFFEKVSFPMMKEYGSMIIAETEAGSNREESKKWLEIVEQEHKILEKNFFEEIEKESLRRFMEKFSLVWEKKD